MNLIGNDKLNILLTVMSHEIMSNGKIVMKYLEYVHVILLAISK